MQDSDKIAMRIRALKSGRVVVTVSVIAPKNAVRVGHAGVFSDSVNVEIFDDLQVANDLSRPMLLAPGIRYQLKTNKDQVSNWTTIREVEWKSAHNGTANFLPARFVCRKYDATRIAQ